MKKFFFFLIVVLTSVQMMAQDVTDGRTYFSFLEGQYVEGVTSVASDEEFNIYLSSGATIMAMFEAFWCGPCRMILPYFVSLPSKYPTVAFIKVNVDECSQTATEQNIQMLPTFILYKNGEAKLRILGANKQELDKVLHEEATL